MEAKSDLLTVLRDETNQKIIVNGYLNKGIWQKYKEFPSKAMQYLTLCGIFEKRVEMEGEEYMLSEKMTWLINEVWSLRLGEGLEEYRAYLDSINIK